MGTAAVVTNGMVMCFTAERITGAGRAEWNNAPQWNNAVSPPALVAGRAEWATWQKLMAFLCVEHGVLFIKFLVGLFIPDQVCIPRVLGGLCMEVRGTFRTVSMLQERSVVCSGNAPAAVAHRPGTAV
jgi:hypothetical protein